MVVSGEGARKKVGGGKFREVFPGAELVNLYGCTEVSGDVTSFLISSSSTISLPSPSPFLPIGSPLPNCSLLIVDPLFSLPLPPGLPGKIMVGGAFVAPFYMEDTFKYSPIASNFPLLGEDGEGKGKSEVENGRKNAIPKFSEKWSFFFGSDFKGHDWAFFDTGDRGIMIKNDPVFSFLGREGTVWKVGGGRVSGEEIEKGFREGGKEVVVVCVGGEEGGGEESNMLVGVVLEESRGREEGEGEGDGMLRLVESKKLKKIGGETLLAWMVPSVFFVMTKWPLTSTGKLDRFIFIFMYFYLFLFIFMNFYLFLFIFIYFYLFLFIFIYFYFYFLPSRPENKSKPRSSHISGKAPLPPSPSPTKSFTTYGENH